MKKYENFRRNLSVLETAGEQDQDNAFVMSGIIDKFFLQFELSWKLMKQTLAWEGVAEAKTGSPREIIKAAYRYYPCIDEMTWLSMLSHRNNVSHEYNEDSARELMRIILTDYIPAFRQLDDYLSRRYGEQLKEA